MPYHLTADGIKADLTQGDDRPTWPLSAYGPGRDAPRQLLEGPLEQSPEELRVQYYVARAGGSTQQYEQNERSAVDEANQRAQQILNDVDGAVKYIIDGKDQHPNRDDQVLKTGSSFNWTTRPSPDQPSAATTGGTAFGQASTPFGGSSTSAFGKPSPATPAFGQSTFSQSSTTGSTSLRSGQTGSTSAFGKPSGLGSGSSAFGQPSNLGGGSSAFGKPSAIGGASPFSSQNTSSTSPFGQTSASQGAPTFGQTSSTPAASPFGQASAPTGGSAFGQPSAPGRGTAFGQAPAPGSGTEFGKPSPFGAAASSAPGFGSSTPFGAQASSSTSAFGQPSQPGQQSTSFGQSSQPAQPQSTFGKATPFGSSGGTTSTFGQSSLGNSTPFGASSTTSAFGRPSAPATAQSQPAFGSTTANGSSAPFGSQQTSTNPGFASQAARTAPGQRLTSFKGRPITYHRLEHQPGKPEDKKEYAFYRNQSTGKEERVWVPDGQPGPNPDVEALPEVYEALGSALKQLYDVVREKGVFEGGVVPEVPPKREWVSWEL